jgi:hypothetical protein
MRKPVIALLARDLPADISLIIGNSHIFAYVYLNYTHRHETCQASIAVSIRMVKVDFGFNNLETCFDALYRIIIMIDVDIPCAVLPLFLRIQGKFG